MRKDAGIFADPAQALWAAFCPQQRTCEAALSFFIWLVFLRGLRRNLPVSVYDNEKVFVIAPWDLFELPLSGSIDKQLKL